MGDVASTSSGATPKAGDPRYYTGGNVPFLKIGDLTDGVVDHADTLITEDAVSDARLRLLAPETVLVAMYGSIGKTGILGFRATTNQAILALDVDRSQAEPRFVHAALLDARPELVGRGRGATQKNINKRIVENLTIPLPSLEEQRRIIDVFAALDCAVATAAEAAQAASNLATCLRSQFYGRADIARVPLREAVEVTMGRQRSPKYQTGDHLVPYLRSANAKDGCFDLSDVLEMNFTPAEQEKFGIREGDVMVTEGCGSLSQIGANAVWHEEIPSPVCFQNTLLRVRAIDGTTTPEFVAHWARYAFESGAFAEVASGTSIFHIGALRAAEMEFPDVPLVSQQEIARTLDAVESAAASARTRVVTLQTLAASVASRLLSGAHEIPESYDRLLGETTDAHPLAPATV